MSLTRTESRMFLKSSLLFDREECGAELVGLGTSTTTVVVVDDVLNPTLLLVVVCVVSNDCCCSACCWNRLSNCDTFPSPSFLLDVVMVVFLGLVFLSLLVTVVVVDESGGVVVGIMTLVILFFVG